MKRCIFHYPGKVDSNPKVGSAVRPKMMLEAFKQIGYEVDEVTGSGKERKEKIKKIKKNIKNGTRYDFVYSESRNIPTLLSDDSHIPTHPLQDFSFLRYCKKNRIKIGIFYRDMHWKFDLFKTSVSLPKRIILVPMFYYDLIQYKKCTDILYVPTNLLAQYLPYGFTIHELPPGGNIHEEILAWKKTKDYSNDKMRLFYVGGVTGLYDMKTLFQAVKTNDKVLLTVCTPADQWEAAKGEYQSLLCDRISVIHKKNNELGEFYKWADMASVCFEKNKYADLAMPIKAFEAISYGIPIITSDNTAVSRIVQAHDIGWVINYSVEEMNKLFNRLAGNIDEIKTKTENTINVSHDNTWQKRAEKVAEELTK